MAILMLSQQLKTLMIILYRIHNKVVTTCKQHLQICSPGSWPIIKPHPRQKLLKLHGAKIITQAR
jgi:sarcosine oxidase gamma subunit